MPRRRASAAAHEGDRRARRRRAARFAYAGGALLVLTGGSGALTVVEAGWSAVNRVAPALGSFLWPLFLAAFLAAALGGLSVLLGGYALSHHRRWLGKVLIGLGAGAGLLQFGFLLLVLVLTGGDPVKFLLSMAASLHGLGVLLALYAQATS